MNSSNSKFLPSASLVNLQARADIVRRARKFFDDRGFLEVETPALSRDTVVDRYLQPIPVAGSHVSGGQSDSDRTFWLQTSPEFAMKRMLAGGAPAIYQICKAFRKDESGRLHNPEFSMLEWYRVGDDMLAGMDLLAEFVETILDRPPTVRMTYAAAFRDLADVDVQHATAHQLAASCRKHGIDTGAFGGSTDRDTWLNLLLSTVIEPALAATREPKLIYDWPVSQSALAQVRTDPDGAMAVAERFEIYVDGIELANGYHELLDADELLRRNQANNRLRISDGEIELPEDSHLLTAMRHGLPACAGVALGVDRLILLALAAKSLAEVIAFPIDRA